MAISNICTFGTIIKLWDDFAYPSNHWKMEVSTSEVAIFTVIHCDSTLTSFHHSYQYAYYIILVSWDSSWKKFYIQLQTPPPPDHSRANFSDFLGWSSSWYETLGERSRAPWAPWRIGSAEVRHGLRSQRLGVAAPRTRLRVGWCSMAEDSICWESLWMLMENISYHIISYLLVYLSIYLYLHIYIYIYTYSIWIYQKLVMLVHDVCNSTRVYGEYMLN